MQVITTKSQFQENIRLQEWTMAIMAYLSQVLNLNQYAIIKSVQLQFDPQIMIGYQYKYEYYSWIPILMNNL